MLLALISLYIESAAGRYTGIFVHQSPVQWVRFLAGFAISVSPVASVSLKLQQQPANQSISSLTARVFI